MWGEWDSFGFDEALWDQPELTADAQVIAPAAVVNAIALLTVPSAGDTIPGGSGRFNVESGARRVKRQLRARAAVIAPAAEVSATAQLWFLAKVNATAPAASAGGVANTDSPLVAARLEAERIAAEAFRAQLAEEEELLTLGAL